VKLEVFQASKGDCLLLTSDGGTRVLVDGGMDDAYPKHIAPAMARLRERGEKLDLLYVSHIDDDHIGGVLELLNDEVDWRVFEFQKDVAGNPDPKPPRAPRPPAIDHIWHNAFNMQLGRENTRRIEDALSASAALFAASTRTADLREAARLRELATGVTAALRVSHRVSGDQLDIPLNHHFGGDLAMEGMTEHPIAIGSLKVTVIGPSRQNIDNLRKWWDDWVNDVDNRDKLAKVREDMKDDARRLDTGGVEDFGSAIEERALEFSDGTTKRLTKREKITEPNLASLMLYVQCDGKKVLLTGDGAGEDILAGLERATVIEDGGRLHVDVLKVQHHGATANVQKDFCERVTADHYVLCGNGDHQNPEPDVLNRIIDSRTDARHFKLWFNSSVAVCGTETREKHMAKVEKLVKERADDSGGRMKYRFLERGHSFALTP